MCRSQQPIFLWQMQLLMDFHLAACDEIHGDIGFYRCRIDMDKVTCCIRDISKNSIWQREFGYACDLVTYFRQLIAIW
jgi:hypothetical protein